MSLTYQTENSLLVDNTLKNIDSGKKEADNSSILHHHSDGQKKRMTRMLFGVVAAMTTTTAGLAIKYSRSNSFLQLSRTTRYSVTELIIQNGDITPHVPVTESDLNSNCRPNMLEDFRAGKFYTSKSRLIHDAWKFDPPGSDGYPIPKSEQLDGHYSCEEFCTSCVGGYYSEPSCSTDGVWNCRPVDPEQWIPECNCPSDEICTCIEEKCKDEYNACFVQQPYSVECFNAVFAVLDSKGHNSCIRNKDGIRCHDDFKGGLETKELTKCGFANCGSTKDRDRYMACRTKNCFYSKGTQEDINCAIHCYWDANNEET